MKTTLTKCYEFSASYAAQGGRIEAHNYHLAAVLENAPEAQEPELDRRMRAVLIDKVHSSDLGQDVDFLRGVSLSDVELLKAFWPLVAELSKPATLASLSLERDRHTRWTLAGPR